MTVADALMLALGVIAVGSGALVVTSTHLVRAGLYLVISLGAIAGLYLVLGAELVAWVQVLVYVGAVVVLLLFAVMLTRAPIGPSTDLDRPAGPAALIGAGVGFGLAALLADAFRWTRYNLPPTGTPERVGGQIFGGWVLPFEVLSILLLAALVGAIVLSRPDLGARPDPSAALVPADVPAPDPVAESAAVVARLERIAARQSAAQSRLRQAAAEQRAETAAPTAPDPTAPDPTAPASAAPSVHDVLKGKAADVVFGAQARRTRLGGDEPPEPGTPRDDVIEGTVTESSSTGSSSTGSPSTGSPPRRRPARSVSQPTERPGLEAASQGSAASTPRTRPTRPEVAPSARPAIEAPSTARDQKALPDKPAAGDKSAPGDKPALPDPPGTRRPRVAGRPDRPALPSSGDATDEEGDA